MISLRSCFQSNSSVVLACSELAMRFRSLQVFAILGSSDVHVLGISNMFDCCVVVSGFGSCLIFRVLKIVWDKCFESVVLRAFRSMRVFVNVCFIESL